MHSLSGHWLNLEETTEQLKQKPGCWRRKDEERVRLGKNTEVGEDRVSEGLSLLGELFCLYYIPSVSCYSSVPVSAERGLTKKKVK